MIRGQVATWVLAGNIALPLGGLGAQARRRLQLALRAACTNQAMIPDRPVFEPNTCTGRNARRVWFRDAALSIAALPFSPGIAAQTCGPMAAPTRLTMLQNGSSIDQAIDRLWDESQEFTR